MCHLFVLSQIRLVNVVVNLSDCCGNNAENVYKSECTNVLFVLFVEKAFISHGKL